jgi:hypothetical protein
MSIEQKTMSILNEALHDCVFQFEIEEENKTYHVVVKSLEVLPNGRLAIDYGTNYPDFDKAGEICRNVLSEQLSKKKVKMNGVKTECHNTWSKRFYRTSYTMKNIFEIVSRSWKHLIFPITVLSLFLN